MTSQLITTIGHSNRSLEQLLEILRGHGVERVVDIRKMPRSRANPQFNEENLRDELPTAGFEYVHAPALTGLRRGTPSSINDAWRNRSFRAFADYMQTPEFADGVDDLVDMARERRVAIMCSEALPWRCHRSLVADALVVRGVAVRHLMTPATFLEHSLPEFARVEGTRITYPGDLPSGEE